MNLYSKLAQPVDPELGYKRLPVLASLPARIAYFSVIEPMQAAAIPV
jgi:hypothetical protein